MSQTVSQASGQAAASVPAALPQGPAGAASAPNGGTPPATSSATPGNGGSQRPRVARPTLDPGWTVDDSADLYNLRGWGKGFFDVNKKGHVVVRPTKEPSREIDLLEVVQGLRDRGLRTPVLLHFSDLLQRRLLA